VTSLDEESAYSCAGEWLLKRTAHGTLRAGVVACMDAMEGGKPPDRIYMVLKLHLQSPLRKKRKSVCIRDHLWFKGIAGSRAGIQHPQSLAWESVIYYLYMKGE
jgi:hypothetical protein